jgi:hypothetical protein
VPVRKDFLSDGSLSRPPRSRRGHLGGTPIWDRPERHVQGGAADVVLVGRLSTVQVARLQARQHHGKHRMLADRLPPARPAQPLALSAGPDHPCSHSLPDQLPLHLGHRRQDREHQPAG